MNWLQKKYPAKCSTKMQRNTGFAERFSSVFLHYVKFKVYFWGFGNVNEQFEVQCAVPFVESHVKVILLTCGYIFKWMLFFDRFVRNLSHALRFCFHYSHTRFSCSPITASLVLVQALLLFPKVLCFTIKRTGRNDSYNILNFSLFLHERKKGLNLALILHLTDGVANY